MKSICFQKMLYSEELKEIARSIALSSNYEERIVALNLLSETRSIRECEDEIERLLKLIDEPEIVARLADALKQYRALVRKSPDQTFLRGENLSNIAQLDPDEDLVHVWNPGAFLVNLDEDHPLFEPFGRGNRTGGGQRNDIEEWLNGADRDRTRLRNLLDLSNLCRPGKPGNPVWAARWEDAKSFIKLEDPNTWLDAVGLPPTPQPQHLVLLVYPARRAGTLCRPTQFEAGWFAFHFPSPPCAEVNDGGFTLLMDERSPSRRLISEYIHAQIDWDESDVLAFGKTGQRAGANLQVLRANHFSRLQERFQTGLEGWMHDPDTPPGLTVSAL